MRARARSPCIVDIFRAREPRLLAVDLDGTLLREDRTIAPADVSAIAAARRAGVHVTLVTGRSASGVLSIAREIGLETPLVCGDGAQLVQPGTGRLIARKSLTREVAAKALAALGEVGLTCFVLTHDAIHARRGDGALAPWVMAWSPRLELHDPDGPSWPVLRDVAVVLALGPHELARRGLEAASTGLPPSATSSARPLGVGEVWAVRVQVRSCTQGTGLAALAARIGARRSGVAYVGSGHGDLSALLWSGRSFCMGQAPADVRRAADETLRATSASGGGVAEVVERWL